MPSKRPVITASFSLVPTGSVLATSTGSSYPGEGVHRAERADAGQHLGAVCRGDNISDTALDVLGRFQVDSGLFVS